MKTEKIILASASPRRRELLHQIGLETEVLPSRIEEKPTATQPEEVVEELSRQKCLDVAGRVQENGVVLGADTVVALDGKIMGKPGSAGQAAEMLKSLQGRSHQVFTGVTLAEVRKGRIVRQETFSERTEVFLFPMTEEEIEAYILSGEPFDKAGAYGIQGSFARHVESIEGDYNNVVGLPVAAVYQRLKKWQPELTDMSEADS
ncbi:MAG TPA: septum formation protein Maf [Candidatus Scatomonas merdavium]|nr:septum formation protein Maf [Candidatus Scatomonas merdavium]